MSATVTQSSETERFKKSVSGSIKSLFNSGGRTYFILEHKTKSDKHKIGETREFIGDYVELGRGDSYAVNFGDDCSTVSRPHAAIIRKANGWVIKQLSQTNPTFVNGQRISQEWHLSNGDEIQLSVNGPVVAFLTPPDNKVGTMGITIRMKAVVNEAIKPYKSIIATIALIFIAVVGGGIYFLNKEHKANVIAGATIDSLKNQFALVNKKLSTTSKITRHDPAPKAHAGSPVDNPAKLKALYPNVFFIYGSKVTYTFGGETKEKEYRFGATGFLLSDGRFVTARHVVEPWLFGSEGVDSVFNIVQSNGGSVKVSIEAFSPDGSTLDFTTDDFKVSTATDVASKVTFGDKEMNFTNVRLGATDFGVTKSAVGKNGLVANVGLSSSLNASTTVYILGYPFTNGFNGKGDIKPIYSPCFVSRDGLDKGAIDISARSFDTGDSGGPVFILNSKGNYEVIGVVSAEHGNQGIICPISAIDK